MPSMNKSNKTAAPHMNPKGGKNVMHESNGHKHTPGKKKCC